MTLTCGSICIPSVDVVSREIEGDVIIVPLAAGIGETDDELFTLNETGKAIWQKLDGQRTLSQVAEELGQDFAAAVDELEADVLGFATELVRRGILSVKE